MDIITIDLKLLKDLNLTINEYLTLLKMYMMGEGDTDLFPFASSHKIIDDLTEKHWIIVNDNESTGGPKLDFTKKANRLFDQEDLFQEFHNLFPVRVPDGSGGFRPVSAASANAKSAQTARHIWIKNVGKNQGKQREVIEALRKELVYKEKQGNLRFMNNIHTWLRQAKWEDWIDIPELPTNDSNIKQL